jgi:hypothetical protein
LASHDEITQMPEDPLAPVRLAAEHLYRNAGIGPTDIDAAYLYDSFTITVALQLLAYGLDRGRGLPNLIRSVGIGPDGGFPVNTHGGMLSASTGGIFHLIEAVRQLRGQASARQIGHPHTILVTNVGGIFSHHSAVVLGMEGHG